jgi:recombinational DNA repair ATPase RecF
VFAEVQGSEAALHHVGMSRHRVEPAKARLDQKNQVNHLEIAKLLPVLMLNPEGLLVLEHTPRNRYENYPGFVKQRNYGTTIFSFFELPEIEKENE